MEKLKEKIAKMLFNEGLEPSLPWDEYDDSFKEELYATADALLPIIEAEVKAERERITYLIKQYLGHEITLQELEDKLKQEVSNERDRTY